MDSRTAAVAQLECDSPYSTIHGSDEETLRFWLSSKLFLHFLSDEVCTFAYSMHFLLAESSSRASVILTNNNFDEIWTLARLRTTTMNPRESPFPFPPKTPKTRRSLDLHHLPSKSWMIR